MCGTLEWVARARERRMSKTVNQTQDTSLGKLGIEKISEVKNVAEYKMKNGLKVLLVENHTAPVVTLLVVYKVGSRNEAVGYTGATHFLEHMLFKGTKDHNPDKGNGIDDLLTQIGAYWNATTWFDRTSYYEVVPSEFLELCIQLEADRMRNLLLRQEDHDSEMSVVRNELERGENSPDDILEKELYAVAFREHPYHHPTIGWRSDVEGVSMDRLREFYNTFYWPNNATVIILGDFEKMEALEMMHKHYGKIPIAPNAIPDVYTIEPPQEGERRLEVHRAGDLPRVLIGYHVPKADDDDNYPIAAMRHILGSTYERSSRLYKRLIDTSIAAEVYARHDDLRDPGLFMVNAMLNPEVDPTEAETAIHEELARLAKEPVSDEELRRAKAANLKGTILAKADPSSFAFMLGEAESKADWHWLMNYDDRFDAVTKEDIMRVAAKYFVKENRTVGYFYPKLADVPTEHKAVVGPAAATPQTAATPDEPADLSTYLALKTPPVKVKFPEPKGEKPSFEKRVRREVLPNGLTVNLMESPGTDSVGFSILLRAGRYFTHEEKHALAELVGDLLPKGSVSYDKIKIAEALESMGIPGGLEFSVDNYRLSLGTHVVTADLAQYLDLLSDICLRPAFAEDELEKTKVEWKARLTEALNNTKSMAWNAARRSIYQPKHPFYEKTYEEQMTELDEISRDDLVRTHKKLFTPKGSVISVVGDANMDQLLAMIKERFGDWKGESTGNVIIPEAVIPDTAQRHEIFLADKRSADIIIAHPCALKRKGGDFYHAKLANAALGQDTITSRLGQVVRDRAGLTYGIYSGFSDTAYGGAPWSVSLTVNPRNVEKALKLVSLVLDDYLKSGISKEDLDKEAGRAVGSFRVGLASSLGVARVLSEFEFLGIGIGELDLITERYLSATKQQVDEAMRNYFHPNRATTVIAGTLS